MIIGLYKLYLIWALIALPLIVRKANPTGWRGTFRPIPLRYATSPEARRAILVEEHVTTALHHLNDRSAAKLVRKIDWTLFSREEFDQANEPTGDPVERARRTVVRAGMGFGTTGLCGRKTGFRAKVYSRNMTGGSDWWNVPENLWRIHQRLQGVVIENRLSIDLIRHQDGPETLFYCDPPYIVSSRSAFKHGKGYTHEMTDEDHEALADVLHQVEGAVVLSGYHSTLYDRLYADWDRVETTARADGNKKRTEVLWIKKVGRPEVNAPDGDGGLDPARLAPLQHPTSIPRQHQGPEGG